MNIDRATLSDVRAVAEIHVDAWRSAYAGILPADYLAALSVEQREAMWKKTVESGQPELLVAKDNGTVLGWVSFGSCRDKDVPSSQAEVWAICVAPNSWFKGVGRQLWHRARELLSQRGYPSHSSARRWLSRRVARKYPAQRQRPGSGRLHASRRPLWAAAATAQHLGSSLEEVNMHATTAVTANPAVERTCAKSRTGRSLLRWTTAFLKAQRQQRVVTGL